MMKKSLVLCLLFCATVLASSRVDAGERRFTYVYEATTLQKGEWEFAQ